MDSISYVVQVVAAAALSMIPAAPATVPGTVDMVSVSNTSIISQTADQITADKNLKDKVAEATKKEAEKNKTEDQKKEEEKKETAKTAEKENLKLPLEAGKYSYTSDYGLRCAPVTGAGNFHYGMDLAAPNGTPMFSIADGTVTRVVDGVMGSQQGGDVQIESTINGKLMTLRYYHMGNSSQYLKVGDKVKAGQHISDVGTTGMSTGPHLHLEVYEGKFSEQKHRDPEEYFKEIGLEVVAKASANYVNKADHPSSCPGGIEPENPATPAPPVQFQSTETTPAKPSTPAEPAPSKPAAPVTPTPVPTHSPVPQPTTKPTPVPVPSPSIIPSPVSTPSPSAIPSPSASHIQVTIPTLPVGVPTP